MSLWLILKSVHTESYLCEVVVTDLVHFSPLLCYFLGKSRLQFSSASLYRFYEN